MELKEGKIVILIWANEALIRFLVKELGISISSIEILKGHPSREKTLRISGLRNLKHLSY